MILLCNVCVAYTDTKYVFCTMLLYVPPLPLATTPPPHVLGFGVHPWCSLALPRGLSHNKTSIHCAYTITHVIVYAYRSIVLYYIAFIVVHFVVYSLTAACLACLSARSGKHTFVSTPLHAHIIKLPTLALRAFGVPTPRRCVRCIASQALQSPHA